MAITKNLEGNPATTSIALASEKNETKKAPKTRKEIAALGILSTAIMVTFITFPYALNWMEQHREEYEPFLYNILFYGLGFLTGIGATVGMIRYLNPKTPIPESPPSQP